MNNPEWKLRNFNKDSWYQRSLRQCCDEAVNNARPEVVNLVNNEVEATRLEKSWNNHLPNASSPGSLTDREAESSDPLANANVPMRTTSANAAAVCGSAHEHTCKETCSVNVDMESGNARATGNVKRCGGGGARATGNVKRCGGGGARATGNTKWCGGGGARATGNTERCGGGSARCPNTDTLLCYYKIANRHPKHEK